MVKMQLVFSSCSPEQVRPSLFAQKLRAGPHCTGGAAAATAAQAAARSTFLPLTMLAAERYVATKRAA